MPSVRTTGTVGLLVAWVAVLLALTTWSATTPATVVALAVTVLVGAIVDRWWVVAIPGVPALLWSVHALLLTDAADYEEGSPDTAVFFAVAFAGTIIAALVAGLVLRDAVRWGGRSRPGGGTKRPGP